MAERSHRVAVLGGGVIGLASALCLRRRGFDVVLLERGRIGQACSAGNAGWVTPAISVPVPNPTLRKTGLAMLLRVGSPLYIRPLAFTYMAPWLLQFWRACNPESFCRGSEALLRFAADAPQRFRQLKQDGVEFEWREDGLLMVYRTTHAFDTDTATYEALGYATRRIAGDELGVLEPALADRGQAGGLHLLPEGHVRPEGLCAALARQCQELGVEIREGFSAAGFRFRSLKKPVRAVSLQGPDEVHADTFLIATGVAAGRLAEQCGTRMPMQAGKGYSVTVEQPRTRLRHPLYLAEAKVGLSPFGDACLRAAGTMELSGINDRLDPRRLAAFRRSAERALPGVFEGADVRSWVGMRPMLPDGLPAMGRLPSTDNVWINSGHQMLGVTLAPASGEALAALIAGEAPPASFDARVFDPGRF